MMKCLKIVGVGLTGSILLWSASAAAVQCRDTDRMNAVDSFDATDAYLISRQNWQPNRSMSGCYDLSKITPDSNSHDIILRTRILMPSSYLQDEKFYSASPFSTYSGLNRDKHEGELSVGIAASILHHSTIFGYVGMPGRPAYGTSEYRHALLDDPNQMDPSGFDQQVVTAGYQWRNIKLEGSTFSQRSDHAELRRAFQQFGFRSGRLTLHPTENWMLQISRKQNNRIDDIAPEDRMRRTTVSMAYHHQFSAAQWNTTFAVARGVKADKTVVPKSSLFESVLIIRQAHSLFARFERAAAGELFSDDIDLRSQVFGARKLTVGYVYDVPFAKSSRFGIGAVSSRGFASAQDASLLGENRLSYKIFARVQVPY